MNCCDQFGACNQGRRPCVARQACLQPEAEIDAITASSAAWICLGYLLAHPAAWLAAGVLGLVGLAHLAARLGWLA